MTRSRLVLLDVDGTILDEGVIAASVREAVSGARSNGHLVLVATGRSRAEIPQQVLDLGFDGVVSAAGGFVELDGVLLESRTMPPEDVEAIAGFFEAHGIAYSLQSFDDVFASGGAGAGTVPTEGIAKATFFGEDGTAFALVRDGLGERFHVITGTIPSLGDAGGEVSLRGVDKGSALVRLAEHLGHPLADTIAIGDSSNDVEMLAAAGVGIAMGNASDAARAAADEVTTSVRADGVRTAFRRHGLL
ncbi:HAD family hydrolase [Rathayibacter sp. VKM Ac-2760]|uniref:HAD family hydrolase n=1 Tax=Rathayibacter sp. VKM Ac-2760 TaxID=2609253 RepID=UPI0013199B86|nr:HAD family hydrolase [Rathayibacter sp. VKM Ac-2760]QHC60092.1 HAD hydrolase family protein [Rathayibacter sp. VKM Ac-2760]